MGNSTPEHKQSKDFALQLDTESDQFVNPHYDWRKRELIGKGGFGKVFKVWNKQMAEFQAIKQLDMANFNQDYKKQALINQIGIQKELTNSPYTVKYFDHYIGKNYTYIISELCDKDLKNQMEEKGGKLSQKQSAVIFREIIEGFKLLTERGYIHRDVKPQNILIKNKLHKIADFGFSCKADIHGGSKIKQVCGTANYMAPQLLMNEEYSSKCDIWSLGLMLFEMIFGFGPWPQRHPKAYKQSILAKPVSFPYGSNICEYTKDFIMRCLVIEEERRMSWKELFNHPFIVKKDLGGKVKDYPVNPESQLVLQKVQQSSRRKLINLRALFQKFSNKQKLNKEQFHDLITKVDPTITTYETDKIFKAVDLNNDGTVMTNLFEIMFCEVDYRPAEDVASRRIQQIIAMAKARNLNVRSFFDMFDTNKSGTIDNKQFYGLIREIAPQISSIIIKQMWDRFDSDKSGEISVKQFVQEMTRGVPDQQNEKIANQERAKRNLACLKTHLNSIGVTAKQMIRKGDKNNSKTLTIDEFGPMIQKINYVITKEEILEMFKLIDTNKNWALEFQQIATFLK